MLVRQKNFFFGIQPDLSFYEKKGMVYQSVRLLRVALPETQQKLDRWEVKHHAYQAVETNLTPYLQK